MNPLPVVFVSHGAPDFALEQGGLAERLTALGRQLPRPRAVLVVSPHWMTDAPRVTGHRQPPTIHDFRGFGPELARLRYPAPGDPALAERVVRRLGVAGWGGRIDPERGLDHGAWVPLRHLYPDADVPVVQLSLPRRLDAQRAFAFGRALSALSAEGVLVVGSGSLTHNLYEVFHGARDVAYAHVFADWVREAVVELDFPRLTRALREAPHAERAHPTPEHFWPLLIAAGAAGEPRSATVLEGGVRHRVLVIDAFVFSPEAVPAFAPSQTVSRPRAARRTA
jgi:4,5-DOPA dioxygenase extradiol